jgi:hypothetical protein
MSIANECFPDKGKEPVGKAAYKPMSAQQKLEAVAHLTDDVLAALTRAFFEVTKCEKWGKRDISQISGLNETGIGHILAGRRKNLTVETIALLARAMRKRPELVLHDLRPQRNHSATIQMGQMGTKSAATALQETQVHQPRAATWRLMQAGLGWQQSQSASLQNSKALP